MTGRERIRNFIDKKEVDSVPAMPITMMFAGDYIDVPYGTYATDYREHVRGQAAVAEAFDIDYVSAISDPAVEAHDWGGDVIFYDNQPPAIDERVALLADKSKLAALTPPDPAAGKRMSNRIEVVRGLKEVCGSELMIEGWVEGPAAESSDLRGINHFMIDCIDDPEFVTDLFEVVTETAINFARAQIAAGADIIGIGDAAASLVGPGLYNDLVWKYEKRLVDAVREAGAIARLHICGRTGAICNGMSALGCEIVDLDSLAPLRPCRCDSGNEQILLGSIDPVRVLRDRTPKEVEAELARCWDEAGPRFIIGAGCEVPRDTPQENLKALVRFARELSV
jgi:MtaA/CmuA family methyltransferase